MVIFHFAMLVITRGYFTRKNAEFTYLTMKNGDFMVYSRHVLGIYIYKLLGAAVEVKWVPWKFHPHVCW
jgi:hypothetical protein